MDIQNLVATLEPLSSVTWWRVLIRQSAKITQLQNESQKMYGVAYKAATAGDRPDRWQDFADESERHAEKYRQLTSQAWSIYWNAAREIRGRWPELLGELPIADGTTAEEIDPHITAKAIQGLIGRLLSQSQGDTTRHDTKDDTPKKSRKIRPMNAKAADCARLYRADKGKTPLKTIVEDYVDKYGGSESYLMRILNDNPDQWKGDTDTTF